MALIRRLEWHNGVPKYCWFNFKTLPHYWVNKHFNMDGAKACDEMGKIITNLSRGLIKMDTLLTKLCTCMFLLLALHFIQIPGL